MGLLALTAALALALLIGCTGSPPEGDGAETRLLVFVSIPPQAYLVERIGGDRISVSVLVPPGREPHTFEPAPRQVMALGRAKLFFMCGMPFERRLVEKVEGALGRLVVADMSEGVQRRMMNQHGHGEGAGSYEPDPHVWLGPPQIKVLAGNIAAALSEIDSANAELYSENLGVFLEELEAVNAGNMAALAPYRGRKIYVMHPAFGYFADAYGLVQEAVEIEGKSPGTRHLVELIREARRDGVRVIFVQPQFDPSSAEEITAAIGGEVVPIDPLARDVLRNLEEMAKSVKQGFDR
jgi:zinc transport system substrate-binding protein